MFLNIRLVQSHAGGLDHQFAALRHGVARVGHQVHEDLLDLHRVSFHFAELFAGNKCEFDIFTLRQAHKQMPGLREYVSQLTSVTAPKTRQEIFAMITGAGRKFPAGSDFD